MTSQERKIWSLVSNRKFYGFRFRCQYSIGEYIVDFVYLTEKIIIEIDGGQHNQYNNIYYDKKRSLYLENKGFKIIRFWNNEVDYNIEGVYIKLKEIFAIK